MSDFYNRLDERERNDRIARLMKNRPDNLHDYQGCAKDAKPAEPPCDDSLCPPAHIVRENGHTYRVDVARSTTSVPDSLCPPNSEPQRAIPDDLWATYNYIKQRNQMPFARTAYWHRYADLIERVGRAESQLKAMTEDRDLWQQAHDEDCPNKAALDELMRARTCAEETGPKLCPDCDFPYVPISNGPIANGFICAWCDMCRDLAALEAALARARKCAEETAKTPITRGDILGADDGSELLAALRSVEWVRDPTDRPFCPSCEKLQGYAHAEDCVLNAAIAKAEANPSKLRNLALIAFDERVGLIKILEER